MTLVSFRGLVQVSKSALFAVGAPHTWPGLLAALAWLVEMLSYEEKAAAARESSFDERALLPWDHTEISTADPADAWHGHPYGDRAFRGA